MLSIKQRVRFWFVIKPMASRTFFHPTTAQSAGGILKTVKMYSGIHSKRLSECPAPIAKMLQLPINHGVCQRIKHTQAQFLISANDRQRNVKNAFEIVKKYNTFKAVALIDDVVTTGSTVNEISKVLRKAGVEYIEVWCFARAILPR